MLDCNCGIELGHFVFHRVAIPWILLPPYYTGTEEARIDLVLSPCTYAIKTPTLLLISPSFHFAKSSRKPGLLAAPGCKNYNCIRDNKPWDRLGGGEKDLQFFLPLPKTPCPLPMLCTTQNPALQHLP